MEKIFICIFITTVVSLVGTTADVWRCILNTKRPVIPERLFSEPEAACSDIENKFDGVRKHLAQCLDYELDISKLESLFHEFCYQTSDYYEKVPRQMSCISDNIHNLFDCTSRLNSSPDPLPFKIRTKSWKSQEVYDSCQSVSADMSNCSTHAVAGRCGPEAMEVFGRMQVASEPFLTGICLSIAKSVLKQRDFFSEMEEAEEEEVDISVEEVEQNRIFTTAGATDPFVPIWCIIIGLLFAAEWC